MSDKIIVILAKANWCGHCKKFSPIYDLAKKLYKNHEHLKNLSINFYDYDLANENEKNNFMLNHFKAYDKVSGYPTVLVNIIDENNDNYINIEHTVIDSKNDEEDASNRFLENISNVIKSLNSDSKKLYLQEGGEKKDFFKFKFGLN